MDSEYFTNWINSIRVPSKNRFLRELQENHGETALLSETAVLTDAANRSMNDYVKVKLLLEYIRRRSRSLLGPRFDTVFSDLDLRLPQHRRSPHIFVGVPRDSWDRHQFYISCFSPRFLKIEPLILRLYRNKHGIGVTFAGPVVDEFNLLETPMADVPQLTPWGRAIMNYPLGRRLRAIATSCQVSVANG